MERIKWIADNIPFKAPSAKRHEVTLGVVWVDAELDSPRAKLAHNDIPFSWVNNAKK